MLNNLLYFNLKSKYIIICFMLFVFKWNKLFNNQKSNLKPKALIGPRTNICVGKPARFPGQWKRCSDLKIHDGIFNIIFLPIL